MEKYPNKFAIDFIKTDKLMSQTISGLADLALFNDWGDVRYWNGAKAAIASILRGFDAL